VTFNTPIILHPVSADGSSEGQRLFIGGHERRGRAFHRSLLPGMRTRRRSSPYIVNATAFNMQGLAGTIDIMVIAFDLLIIESILMSHIIEPNG